MSGYNGKKGIGKMGYIEPFNGKLRDELINRRVFINLVETQILIEQWRTIKSSC